MAIRFDQQLWNARGEGFHAEDGASNPYLWSSPMWGAWEIGYMFGLGRVATARGGSLRADCQGIERVLNVEQIGQLRSTQPRYQTAVTYAYGAGN